MSGSTIGLADFRAAWAAHEARYLEAFSRVGKSGWLVLGKEVEAFEQDLARFWNVKHAIGVANGLDALEICFRALDVKAGDRFLTTPLSAFATTLAILRAGGVPEFVDVDITGCIDLAQVRKRLQAPNPPRFFVPVHLFGHAMDLEALAALKREFNVEIIEDCAQAIGARSGEALVGSQSQCFATSFYPTKNLGAFGDAGAVLTNSDEIATAARSLRDYGQVDKYVHDDLGMNSRLDEVQAALLRSVQLPELASQTERRRSIARRYLAELKNTSLHLPVQPRNSQSVWHLFPVIVEGGREAFRKHLQAQGISTGLHYPILIPAQKAMGSLSIEAFPVAQRFATHEVSLPLHPFLSDIDVERVIAATNGWKP